MPQQSQSFGTPFATAGFLPFPEFSPNNQQFSAAVLATVSRAGLPFGFAAANVILAGPASGAAALPTYRTLVAADVPGGINGFANPTGLIGLTAVNGTATTAERSDSRHAIDPSIAPTWTSNHTFAANIFVGVNNAPVLDTVSGTIGYFARTAAEIAAGVTPTNYAYQPGDVRRYNAKGDGSTDDSTAFANAALVCGTHPMLIFYTSGGYKIVTPFVLPANAVMLGIGRPLLFSTVAGTHIVSATSVATVTVDGVRFQGLNSSTAPLSGFGGYSANNTGLLTITICTDVRVTNCDAITFYNGITVQQCTRVWVNKNRVQHWTFLGIHVGVSSEFMVDNNDVRGCDQAGGVVAYGISATGNQAGGFTQARNSISFNRIADIPSWDAIASHDCDGLQIIGNDCRNVRHGIDLGHLVSTNVVTNLTIANNYVESTATDTWGGVGAEIGGIIVAGYDATHRVAGVTITGNTVRNFFNVNGMVGAGAGAGCISVSNADDANISGNIITGGGTGNTAVATGMYITGTCNRLSISGNTLQGNNYARGGIRLESVTADVVAISGNSGVQTTVANNHVLVTGSTITQLNVSNNPSNSTAPISISGGTVGYSGDDGTRVRIVVPYSASMVFDCSLGNEFDITATNATAFSISNPVNPIDGRRITLTIRNTSGGALGAVTFGTTYKMSTWTQPANGFSRSVDLRYDATRVFWDQISQTGVDVPN